jgi:hypothetical protein
VPEDRAGRFSTELFERYQRSERALVAALAEMYGKFPIDRHHVGANSPAVSSFEAFRTPASVHPPAPAHGGRPKTLNGTGRSPDRQ